MIGIGCDPELLALVTFAILIIFIWIALYSGYQVIKWLIKQNRSYSTLFCHSERLFSAFVHERIRHGDNKIYSLGLSLWKSNSQIARHNDRPQRSGQNYRHADLPSFRCFFSNLVRFNKIRKNNEFCAGRYRLNRHWRLFCSSGWRKVWQDENIWRKNA